MMTNGTTTGTKDVGKASFGMTVKTISMKAMMNGMSAGTVCAVRTVTIITITGVADVTMTTMMMTMTEKTVSTKAMMNGTTGRREPVFEVKKV